MKLPDRLNTPVGNWLKRRLQRANRQELTAYDLESAGFVSTYDRQGNENTSVDSATAMRAALSPSALQRLGGPRCGTPVQSLYCTSCDHEVPSPDQM